MPWVDAMLTRRIDEAENSSCTTANDPQYKLIAVERSVWPPEPVLLRHGPV